MSIDHIAEGRRREIAEGFDDLLSEGKDTEEASMLLCQKYSITREDVEAIVRGERDTSMGSDDVPQEENGDEDDDDDDDDPEGRKVA